MKRGNGFSLLEVLISTAISLSATLIACRLAVGAQTNWRVIGARVDLQQRARAVADMLSRSILEAGAGPQAGPACRRESEPAQLDPGTAGMPCSGWNMT